MSGDRPSLDGPPQPTEGVELFGKPTKMLTIIWEQCWGANPLERPMMSIVRSAFETRVIPSHHLPDREEVDTSSKISFSADKSVVSVMMDEPNFDNNNASSFNKAQPSVLKSSMKKSSMKKSSMKKSSLKKTSSFSQSPTSNKPDDLEGFTLARTPSTKASSMTEKRIGTFI